MKKLHAYNLPINPRYGIPCLSWSDVVSIESNVGKWLDRQLGLIGKMESDALNFGTFVHAQIKHKKIKGVPHGDHPETKLIFETKKYTMVGKPDDYSDEAIDEYKSAKELWTRKKATEHGQLFAYAFLLWKMDGRLRKKARLTSLETKDDEDAGLYLTGEMRTIEVPIRMLDVLKIQVRFNKAYEKAIQEITRRGRSAK